MCRSRFYNATSMSRKVEDFEEKYCTLIHAKYIGHRNRNTI
jgi:hypothetical protein